MKLIDIGDGVIEGGAVSASTDVLLDGRAGEDRLYATTFASSRDAIPSGEDPQTYAFTTSRMVLEGGHGDDPKSGNAGVDTARINLFATKILALCLSKSTTTRRFDPKTKDDRTAPGTQPEEKAGDGMKTPNRIPPRMRTVLLCLLLAIAGGTSEPGQAATANTTAVEQQSMKERQRIAGEMFQELCKKSGVFFTVR